MSKIKTGYKTLEEAPETERQFCVVEGKDVFYVNDGLLKTVEDQRKSENQAKGDAERLKGDAEKLKAEIEALKKAPPKDQKPLDKKDQKPPTESPEILELKKQLQVIQGERTKEKETLTRLTRAKKLEAAAIKAEMRPQAVRSFDESIGYDETGEYIRDDDGTAKIDPLTGKRETLEKYFTDCVKANPWAANEKKGSGPATSGGLRGAVNSAISDGEATKLKKEYREAIQNNNLRLVTTLEDKAQAGGFALI